MGGQALLAERRRKDSPQGKRRKTELSEFGFAIVCVGIFICTTYLLGCVGLGYMTMTVHH